MQFIFNYQIKVNVDDLKSAVMTEHLIAENIAV